MSEVIDARVLEGDSRYFKVFFSYTNGFKKIQGCANVERKEPKVVIKFNSDIDKSLYVLGQGIRSKLELEILNVIIEYLFSFGSIRTQGGNIVLNY